MTFSEYNMLTNLLRSQLDRFGDYDQAVEAVKDMVFPRKNKEAE